MRFGAALLNLLAHAIDTSYGREYRSTLTTSRGRQCFVILFLALFPGVGWCQTGRSFVSAEAYVGLARVIYVGKIVEFKAIEYEKPLTFIQKLGKPYRLVLEVSETIRGDAVDRLELVLSLQTTHQLKYLREQSAEIMLVGGLNEFRGYPSPEVGIEVQGKQVDGESYHFRLLDPLKVPESGTGAAIASQLNLSYDSCRMFTNELEIVEGRKAILMRVRAFAKENTKMLSGVSLMVPNEFGRLCGSPNAFCLIILPNCPSTRKTLTALKDDPGIVLRRIKSENEDDNLSLVLTETEKALAMFPD